MGSSHPRSAGASTRTAETNRRYHRTLCEPLEPRHMLASLGLGLQLRSADGSQPITEVDVGQTFFLDIVVQDVRSAGAAGVISLPVDLYWDPRILELLTSVPTSPSAIAPANSLLTPLFPEQRFVNGFVPGESVGHNGIPDPSNTVPADANINGLRAGALPNVGSGSAIGQNGPEVFSTLQFQVLSFTDLTPFTIDVSGSMAFADADALDGVATLSSTAVMNENALAVTEFIPIAAPPLGISLSGFVYIDVHQDLSVPIVAMNNVFDHDAGGAPLEMGLPGVTITLVLGENTVATTITGADGSYSFEDLDEGIYTVIETQPPQFISTGSSVGFVLPSNDVRGISTSVDSIAEIRLAQGDHGIDYNFGEIPIPDKRFFLATTAIRELVTEQTGVKAASFRATDGVANTIRVAAFNDGFDVSIDGGPVETIPLEKARVLFVETNDGEDTVELVGTPGDERASSSPGSAAVRLGDDYDDLNFALMAVAARDVSFDGNGGNDLGVLRDGPVDDALVGSGSAATLSAANRAVEFDDFDRVRGLSLTRDGVPDVDTVDQGTIDYVLDAVGKWDPI